MAMDRSSERDFPRRGIYASEAERERTMGGVPPVAPLEDVPATRRRLLKWLIRLGYGAFAVAFLLPAAALRSLSFRSSAVAAGDRLVYAATTPGADVGQPLQAEALEVGTGVQVFPEGKQDEQNNLIEVVRVGQGNDGLVAYSAICTHLGCAVYAGLSQDGNIACPCHGSVFAPTEGAAVLAGPAPRPLPALPIQVGADGVVAATGSFEGPVGPS